MSTPPLVLVVDDDRLMRRLLRQAMESEGLHVAEAENGAAAVTMFEQLAPDVVLLDAVMPVLDGFAACRALQQLAGGPHTPVLLITGLDDSLSVDEAFAAGAADYITKPIHWAVLRQRVRRLLRVRQAEAALRDTFEATAQERERLRTIIETSRDGIVLLGPHQVVLDLNSAALELLHLPGPPAAWRELPLHAAIMRARQYASMALDATIAELRRTQQDQPDATHGEYTWKAGAALHTVAYQSLPVQAAGGMGRVLVFRNVSTERAVARLREDLTKMMVHDLRNPLAASLTASQMLSTSLETSHPDLMPLVTIIANNQQRALALVTNILDVSRLEAGHMPVDAEPVALDATLAVVLNDTAPLAQTKGLTIVCDYPAELGLALADNKLVERVVRNLVGNAVKFTPTGGTITVGAHRTPDALAVKVRDTGPGLAAGIEARLFQKFATGRVEGGGTGLGLAFCKLAVEAMGGLIWATSTLGEGTTFTFTLPRLDIAQST